MKSIYKYALKLEIPSEQKFFLPKGTDILSVAMQDDHIVFWALVDKNKTRTERYTFYLAGTGRHDFEDAVFDNPYLGTVQFKQEGCRYVAHIFCKRGL